MDYDVHPIRAALQVELGRQHRESGPYGDLHYMSVGEDGKVQLEGAVDLEAMAKVAVKAVLDAQAELIPQLKATESSLEKVKAGLRALYCLMVPGAKQAFQAQLVAEGQSHAE